MQLGAALRLGIRIVLYLQSKQSRIECRQLRPKARAWHRLGERRTEKQPTRSLQESPTTSEYKLCRKRTRVKLTLQKKDFCAN
jgi:hypothetical protein